MSHMVPQISHGKWCEIETNTGTWYVEAEFVKDESPDKLIWFCEATEYVEHKFIEGYGARLSAPGYLDCTDWVVFDTEEAARKYLEEVFDCYEEEDDEDQEFDGPSADFSIIENG